MWVRWEWHAMSHHNGVECVQHVVASLHETVKAQEECRILNGAV